MFERLRDEHGFTGGYTIVKDYMWQRERRGREMFVPLAHPSGHAQADFGEAVVIIARRRQRARTGGAALATPRTNGAQWLAVQQKAHFFVMDMPHSDACFVRAYPTATAEAWMDGHVHAFAFFGGVPLSVLYDSEEEQKTIREIVFPTNRCLVAKILPTGRASAPRSSASSCRITCSATATVAPAG